MATFVSPIDGKTYSTEYTGAKTRLIDNPIYTAYKTGMNMGESYNPASMFSGWTGALTNAPGEALTYANAIGADESYTNPLWVQNESFNGPTNPNFKTQVEMADPEYERWMSNYWAYLHPEEYAATQAEQMGGGGLFDMAKGLATSNTMMPIWAALGAGLGGLGGGAAAGADAASLAAGDAMAGAIPAGELGAWTGAGTGGGMLTNAGTSIPWNSASGTLGTDIIGSGTAFNPATATVSDIINAAVASGGNAVPAGMLTPELAAAAASGATISSLSPSLLGQLASGLNSALGTDFTGSQLLSGGLSAIGGLLQGNAASNAAQTSADAQIRAAQIAADAARFKPVGVTTRFGTSQFTKDAQGNVTGAGYTMPADIRAMQDQLLGAAPGMLNQFTGSVAATAPMGTAAQRAMSLGNQYLATDPLAQAKKYYDEQQAVMATGRERDQANMLTGEFNRGTYGLATGGTSGGMMAANPRLEAMYNAQRQQDLGLAAAATQGGMDYAKFGAGMVGTGGDLLKSMYGTQSAAYSPFQTALSGAQTIEGLGQNALDMSVNIGKTASPAQSGQLLATGMLGAANTMQPANAYSPWGSLFSGAGNSIQNWQNQQAQQQQNQQLLNALAWGK